MNKYSVFTLIRMNNTKEINTFLIEKYFVAMCKEEENEDVYELIFELLFNQDDDFSQRKQMLDELDGRYNALSLIKYFSKNKSKEILLSDRCTNFIIYLLTESFSVGVIYICMFIVSLRNMIEIKSVRMILEEYMMSPHFNRVALDCFIHDPDYARYHHISYYHIATIKNTLYDLSFYLDYPDEFDNSVFYYATHLDKWKEQLQRLALEETGSLLSNSASINKEHIVDLLNKYRGDVFEFDKVQSCIHDFDEALTHFNMVNFDLALALSNVFAKNDKLFIDSIDLFLILLTRSKKISTVNFAINMLKFIPYDEKNDILYQKIEQLAAIYQMCVPSIGMLMIHPNYQEIGYRIASTCEPAIRAYIMQTLDLSLDKNKELFKKHICETYSTNKLSLQYLEDKNLLSLINEKDPLFISNIVAGLLNGEDFLKMSDAISLIDEFYKNYAYDKRYNYHLFSAELLTYCDRFQNNYSIECDALRDIVYQYIDFAEEQSYIDDSLDDDKIKFDEVFLMMSYYNYYPLEQIERKLERNPDDVLQLLFFIKMGKQPEQLINYCLDYVEHNIDMIYKKSDRELMSSKLTPDEICTYLSMVTLADLIPFTKVYYPNLYHIGLHYFDEDVRYKFYLGLKDLFESRVIDDFSVIDQVAEDYQLEPSDKIKSLMGEIIEEADKEIS